MSKWKSLLQKVTHNTESKFDELKHKLTARLNLLEKIQVVIYHSYASNHCIFIRGRVLEDKGIKQATDHDSVWDNLLRTYKRLETDEVPNALLEIEFNGVKKQVRSDEEGYFTFDFELPTPINYQQPRHQFKIQLLDFPVNSEVNAAGEVGEVFLPPSQSDFGVISDVDDTIMRTDATSLLKMAKATFLQNSRTRIAFKGVSKFYEGLRVGTGKQSDNPFFYVSSSPWNLFDLIKDFINVNEIPVGPILLRDYGIDESKFLISTHGQHKRVEIEKILNTYPGMKFILIGDSGQEDTFIYAQIAKDYPDRILSVYIRDAQVLDQVERVTSAMQEAVVAGVDIHLVPDSFVAAQHAVSKGYMSEEWLQKIEEEMKAEAQTDAQMGELLD